MGSNSPTPNSRNVPSNSRMATSFVRFVSISSTKSNVNSSVASCTLGHHSPTVSIVVLAVAVAVAGKDFVVVVLLLLLLLLVLVQFYPKLSLSQLLFVLPCLQF